MERNSKDVKYWFKTKNEARLHIQRVRYDLGLGTQKLDEVAVLEKAHVARVYYKFKSGHTVIYTYLNGISWKDNDG